MQSVEAVVSRRQCDSTGDSDGDGDGASSLTRERVDALPRSTVLQYRGSVLSTSLFRIPLGEPHNTSNPGRHAMQCNAMQYNTKH